MLILNHSGDIMDCYGVFPLNVNNAVYPTHFNQLKAKYNIIPQ